MAWVIAIALILFAVPVAATIMTLQWCLRQLSRVRFATALASADDSWRHGSRGVMRHRGHRERRGRHRKPPLLKKIGSEHGRRLLSFGLIGFSVFAAGLAVQVFLVQVANIPPVPAYVTQLVLSVQANFFANYRWTWGDRDAPFWRSCWRYNIKRAGAALLSLVLYPLLIKLGMNYLAANALLVIGLTPANYILGHFWTFATASGRAGSEKASETRRTGYGLGSLTYRAKPESPQVRWVPPVGWQVPPGDVGPLLLPSRSSRTLSRSPIGSPPLLKPHAASRHVGG